MIDLRTLDGIRDRDWQQALAARTGQPWGPEEFGGCFRILVRNPGTHVLAELRCMAASGEGWDHVSVTTSEERCPRWDEMDRIKRLFFLPGEVAMQLHVAPVDHISHHPFCLHLWRPHLVAVPLPPKWMIA